MGKLPLYPVGFTPSIVMEALTTALLSGEEILTVTRLPTSVIAEMLEDDPAPAVGRVKTTGAPKPPAIVPEEAGVNEVMISPSPGTRLPALATKTRELLGRIAACVGVTPMFSAPMSVSPETSICIAVPGFPGAL